MYVTKIDRVSVCVWVSGCLEIYLCALVYIHAYSCAYALKYLHDSDVHVCK